jgi:Flp pilus assembly protein TadD
VTDTYDLFQQGRKHLRAGLPAQATVALEKAKQREPEKASIREALGIAYFRIRRWSEAETEFRKLVELSPADHYANLALARTLDKLGRSDEAARYHAIARALSPARSPADD